VRLVVVSNRLPVVLEHTDGGYRIAPGSGGLVTALMPALRRNGGLWIGWPGCHEPAAEVRPLLAAFGRTAGYELEPVLLTPEERKGFYEGFANEIVWPLFHDFQSQCNFVPGYRASYVQGNSRFAEVVGRYVRADDFVWVHDYHPMGVGRRLRECGVTNRLGFFLHIPFPPPDIFSKLPWRIDVLTGLLKYDVVGFQTPRDLENFLDCVRKLLPDARRRQVQRLVRIDHASDACRLRAFQLALRRYPELRDKVTLLQVVIPSRDAVTEYQDLKGHIERLVSQINGEFTAHGWVPIHHVFRGLDREELVTYYRLADVALVIPLKDGMNLVAKEYCACQIDGDGVLILSEFAGAAVQLQPGAVLVNPYDLEHVAEAIRRAVSLTAEQRRPAMRRLRRSVRRFNVHWWVSRFLAAGAAAGLQFGGRPGDGAPGRRRGP
jgi:trehalose 6-phosphate synthase